MSSDERGYHTSFALRVIVRRPQSLALRPKLGLLMTLTGIPYESWLKALKTSARRCSPHRPIRNRFRRLRSVFQVGALRSLLRGALPSPRALASGWLLLPSGAVWRRGRSPGRR